MSNADENHIETAVLAGKQSVTAVLRIMSHEGVPMTFGDDGDLGVAHGLIEELERRQTGPRRRKGCSNHYELDSFIAHVNAFKGTATTVWANVSQADFLAVYNYHPATPKDVGAAWCDHRAKYECPLAPEWKAWTAQEQRWMSQHDLADWLEGRKDELVGGETLAQPIEMLSMARDLQIYTKGTFQKKIDPATGQYSMVSKQEHTSESTKIPQAFGAALRIFEGGDQYRIECRLQFRLADGVPMFKYLMHRAEEVKRDAFGEMRDAIRDQCQVPVFAGIPER